MSVIKVENLRKTYSYYKKEEGVKNSFKNLFHREKLYKEALKGISFEIEEGEIVGFLGPNGSGKTTTMKLLSGILYPTEGNAHVLGYTPWDRNNEFKKQFSLVMAQKNQLWWDLPANESILLNKYIYELDDIEYRHSLEELTELLDVKDLLPVQVRRLSLGERMKIEIIAALIHRPKVIFLDEPTIGLDIIAQRQIRNFFKYYSEQNKTTIMLTSHYMQDIESLCKRAVVINQGELVHDGLLKNINETIENKKIIKFKLEENIDFSELLKFGDIKNNNGEQVAIEVLNCDVKSCAKVLIDKFSLTDFTIENLPLEQCIEYLFQKGDDEN